MDRHGHTPKGCPVVQRVPIFLATDKGEFVISVIGHMMVQLTLKSLFHRLIFYNFSP